MKEQIKHPSYYTSGGIEVADFIEAYGLNFNLGNVVKYLARAGKKQGEDAVTALLKAEWYLTREIIRVENEQEATEPIHGELRPLIYDQEYYPEDKEL